LAYNFVRYVSLQLVGLVLPEPKVTIYGFADAAPGSRHSEGFSVMEISGLPRGFSTCCLRFTSGVATTPAGSLPAGGLAFIGRELNPLDRYKRFQITFSYSGFILAREGPSFISRTVTHRRVGRRYS
jgi:hypothetical protein